MLGRLRFVVLYLLSALGGSVAQLLLADPGQSSVGASGASSAWVPRTTSCTAGWART